MKNNQFWSAALAFLLVFFSSSSSASSFEPEQVNSSIVAFGPVDEFIGNSISIYYILLGCLYEDVCQPHETCHNGTSFPLSTVIFHLDGLFGKCLDEEKAELATLEQDEFSPNQLSLLFENLPEPSSDISWTSLLTQCRIRSLIFAIKVDLPLSTIDSVCNQPNDEPVDSDSKTEEEDDFSSQMLARSDKRSYFRFTQPDDSNVKAIQPTAMEIEKEDSLIDGNVDEEERIKLTFPEPMEETDGILSNIAENLQDEFEPESVQLSPDGKNLEIDLGETVERPKRFADMNMIDGGLNKRASSSEVQHSVNAKSWKIILIGASIAAGVVILVGAISAPFLVRRLRGNSAITLKTKAADDEEKFLKDTEKKSDSTEGSDILGPLGSDAQKIMNEAKNSAKGFISSASEYLAKLKKDCQGNESTKVNITTFW
ncbi:hypothetical protein Ciccas_010704 [Cichlidogyrus casuarinus]|uniref:Uncharacterized protein n=1 Tax=Cichlidogyrus casuarinus TaxID=1844966 RepID=A0ABD2PTF7_9PLAT